MISLLPQEGVVCDLRATSKKQVLQTLARRAADLTGLDERDVLSKLIEREKLGSTGMGDGVAIPHARLAGLDKAVGVFAKLAPPIDFDSPDHVPVDLIFVLIAPESGANEHLQALARISRALGDTDLRAKLRGADSADALFILLTGTKAIRAA